MKSINAQKYIETLHDASALLAYHTVELAETDLIQIAINAHKKSYPYWNNCKERISSQDCIVECEYQRLFIRKLTSN